MDRIKQLSAHEAQKIAAGEVVERPANVVKELIENSIDASANNISLYLEDGGKKLIKIIDNGFGMSLHDAKMSIKQYATSKISSIDDLNTINTYGFRGEALSSIAAVSNLKLITKEKDQSCGVMLEIIGSQIIQEKAFACNTGTEIIIEDLFFNVPARKKFLKSKETEYRSISQLFHAFCFSYPEIYFKLYSENKLVYNCPPTENLTKRIEQLYEKNLTKELLLINGKEDRLSLTCLGAITDSSYSRYDRSHIFIFVNKRWVKNTKLSQALIKGYQNILQPNKYPAGFLFLTIDKTLIDINIHPRKEEVQFIHPKIVENTIELAVKKALEINMNLKLGQQYGSKAASLTNGSMSEVYHVTRPVCDYFTKSEFILPFRDSGSAQCKLGENNDHKMISNTQEPARFENLEIPIANEDEQSRRFELESKSNDNLFQKKIPAVEPVFQFKIIGQLYQTYIILENENGLVLIDQHAAHERIIYERLKNQFNNIPTVKLIFPSLIELNKLDVELINPYLEIFTHFGLMVEPISNTQLAVKEIPVFLNNKPVNDVILQIISLLNNQESSIEEIKLLVTEKIHAHLSCIAAVKAGDTLNTESMNEIITSLYSCNNKLTCPHGRPTIWQISLEEIKRKFKRDYK